MEGAGGNIFISGLSIWKFALNNRILFQREERKNEWKQNDNQ